MLKLKVTDGLFKEQEDVHGYAKKGWAIEIL